MEPERDISLSMSADILSKVVDESKVFVRFPDIRLEK